MAILNGLLKKMVGSAGQLTFKTLKGQTIVSEKVTQVSNPRTEAQQRQRMKWVNIIRMYSGIAPLLKNGFEKKDRLASDYNMFVKLNSAANPVYLTKPEADGGGCIAAPYILTAGSLPSIVVTGEGANAVTDIALGSLAISASTTVAEFSNAVVLNNADYNYGDQISFYNVLQRVNAETGVPYCQFMADYVVLDKDSQVKLYDMVNPAGYAVKGGFLAHGENEGDGVFAWVHSLKEQGKTKVSTQHLIANNSMLAGYTSTDAYAKASASYGGAQEVFLTPDVESAASAPVVTPSQGGSNNQQTGGNTGSGTVTPPSGGDNGLGE